jgi:hypothetical protein
MLIGAVANARPDIYAGMIAEVPFVDVLNTMLDETLPLTPPEWPEWGNPITDAAAFRNILSYSPYENVRAQDYPALLVLAGLTDPRVTYWEPAKWVARLRATQTGHRVLAFRTNLEARPARPAVSNASGKWRSPMRLPWRRSRTRSDDVSRHSERSACSRWARNSSIDAKRIVPCGSSASIEPSV